MWRALTWLQVLSLPPLFSSSAGAAPAFLLLFLLPFGILFAKDFSPAPLVRGVRVANTEIHLKSN